MDKFTIEDRTMFYKNERMEKRQKNLSINTKTNHQ